MTIKSFRGLNNRGDPLRLGMDWLAVADNVDVTDTGALVRRAHYSLSMPGACSSAYATLDHQRMYVVQAGVLGAMTSPTGSTPLRSGISGAQMYWAEINRTAYYNNGSECGAIRPDNTLVDWTWPMPTTPTLTPVTGALAAGTYRVCFTYLLADGRETGTSDFAELTLTQGQALQISSIPQTPGLTTRVYIAPADSTDYRLAATTVLSALVWNSSPDELGTDCDTLTLDPIPPGADVIQFWSGRVYAAVYMPASNQTAVFFSLPMGFHLFDMNGDFILLPGRVLAMAPHEKALIIGTDVAIYAYDEKLEQLADYGVVPGWCWSADEADEEGADGSLLIWTMRGMCRALPFVNLTADHLSVAPGVQAGAAVISANGQKKFVVALHQGGAAFNQR